LHKTIPHKRHARFAVKRAVDVAAAAIGLVILSPLIGVAALAIRCLMGSPIFFKQERPGLLGVPFTLVKFRTMADTRSPSGDLLPDADRLTALGRFLRRTSLDELPQLWNVLKGDLSLVGPRPLLMRYLQRYSPFQMRRHEVKPGITGWAQVNGRNAITWDEKFALDVWYVDNWSLKLDLKIILLTVVRVFSGRGVTQEGKSTVDEFLGNSGTGDNVGIGT